MEIMKLNENAKSILCTSTLAQFPRYHQIFINAKKEQNTFIGRR